MSSTPPRPDTISRLQRALYPSIALLAAIQLDLFAPLSDGPRTVEQVAEALVSIQTNSGRSCTSL